MTDVFRANMSDRATPNTAHCVSMALTLTFPDRQAEDSGMTGHNVLGMGLGVCRGTLMQTVLRFLVSLSSWRSEKAHTHSSRVSLRLLSTQFYRWV